MKCIQPSTHLSWDSDIIVDEYLNEMTSQTSPSLLLSTKLSWTYTYTLSSSPTSSLRSISRTRGGLWVLFRTALRTRTRSPPADFNKVPSMAIKHQTGTFCLHSAVCISHTQTHTHTIHSNLKLFLNRYSLGILQVMTIKCKLDKLHLSFQTLYFVFGLGD